MYARRRFSIVVSRRSDKTLIRLGESLVVDETTGEVLQSAPEGMVVRSSDHALEASKGDLESLIQRTPCVIA